MGGLKQAVADKPADGVVEGPYWRDVLDQPAALERTIAGLEDRRDLKALGALLAGGQFRRIVLTGMGASLSALEPLALALGARGLSALHVETSELIHHTPSLLDGGSLVVAASQSGRSAEIVRLVELAGGRATLVGVTNDPESPLATRSAHALVTRAGNEATVSCKTYVSALAALAWLRAHLLCEDVAAARAELQALPPAVARVIGAGKGLRDTVTRLAAELGPLEHVFLCGRGESLAAAGAGALIIKEAAHTHAEGLSSAAFRHGPVELAGAGMLVVVYEGTGETAALNRKLADDVRASGARVQLVGASAPAGPFRVPADASPTSRPILEILPAQMLSLALAAARGIEAGRFTRATKITTVE